LVCIATDGAVRAHRRQAAPHSDATRTATRRISPPRRRASTNRRLS